MELLNKEQLKDFDEGLHGIITNFQNSFGIAAKIENLTTDKNKIIDKSTPDHSHAEARSTMLKFPNVFKNSNLKTFQTITLTDPTFNQEIISKGGFESSRIKIYRTLNNYIGKKVTPETQEILTEQKIKLNNINNEIIVAANKAGLDGVEETFVPIDINKKIKAYKLMATQVRTFRSPEMLRALALLRGGQCNFKYAEGFEIIRWID